MEGKSKNLNKIPPSEAAKIVGSVEKSNYLAHSIREIEQVIARTLKKHYRIITYVTLRTTKKSSIRFFDQCCEIRLPAECEEMDDKLIRLTLAHELGHLIFNIEKLTNPETLEKTASSSDEELFAWEFAFYLIRIKSMEHQNNITQSKFIYNDCDLKKMLFAIVRDKKPEIYDDIVKSLNYTQ